MKKAVIFIPGIRGTKLFDANTIDNEILWQDIRFNFEDFKRMNLTFESNNHYFEEDFGTIVEPLHVEPLAYKEFWRKLQPDYDYKFIFPYDWRIPNEENGRKLHDFIELLIQKSTASSKVDTIAHFDVIAHSMGNMPIRNYIKEYGMGKINKVIFVCPPFKGAPDSVSALATGQGMFFNRDETRKMARSFPSVYQLLPTYPNCTLELKTEEAIDLWKKDNWQKNLITEGDNPETNQSIKKFIELLSKTKPVLDDLETWRDNLTQEEKNKILVLVKTEMKTLCNVVVEKQPDDHNPDNYFDFDLSLMNKEGDGVVPNASACHYYDEFATYAFYNRTWQDDYKHPFILKDSRVQRMINNFLNTEEDTSNFQHNIFGRTVKRVIGLKQVNVKENGVNHKLWKIVT